ncbi:MAG: RloB family protein [Clostridiaceae bacterium]|nr:RloB family protein [Clostridiaceae bacterium]
MASDNDILAVSNPSFELFLLLHYDDSVKNIIFPEEEQILENKKDGKRRYITKRFTDLSGMNPKENPAVGNLASKVDIAIRQEKLLNENIYDAIGRLTCNIGNIIESIRKDNIQI